MAKKATNKKLADVAYGTLLRMITSGQLEPSQRLTEAYLCEALKMSRTPVREAMNRLAADGLIVGKAHHSMAVRELSDLEVIDLHYVREAFESEAARLAAARITDEELQELHDFCNRMDAIEADDEADYVYQCREIDRSFHMRIMELSGVKVLAEFYERHHILQLHLFAQHWTRMPEMALRSREPSMGDRHRPLVEALASRDPEVADRMVRAMVKHGIEHHKKSLAERCDAVTA